MMKEEIDPRSSLPEQAAAEAAGKSPPDEQQSAGSLTTPEGEALAASEQRPETDQRPATDSLPETEQAASETESVADKETLPDAQPALDSSSPAGTQAVVEEPAENQEVAEVASASALPQSEPLAASGAAASPPDATSPPEAASSAAAVPAVANQQSAAWRSPWPLVVLVALGLATWQWFETRQKLSDTQQELARRLADSDSSGAEIRALSKGATEQVAGVLGRLAALEEKIGESQSQQAMLEQLYQDVARNRDELALAEVEQSVTLAAQQLQLAGNVQAAVLALQAADARLAASSRPQFVSLRKVLSSDLELLRALPQIDIAAMSLRLESVINALDTIPLAVDGRPQANGGGGKDAPETPGQTSPAPVSAEWPALTSAEFWQKLVSAELWQQLGREVWGEVKSLIRIQRFDRDEPAMLTPGQAFFLRENLKLRLLNARLALLARDQWTFQNELKHAQAWMNRYFDASDSSLQTAQANLEQLIATEINIEMPTLNESRSAVKTFKLGQERQ
ncbi:MAG: putative uroporphyrinogen-III C-methyltransferase [Candidatus Accumulibacter appositus]|uniref:Putative uroporphyrinogen-III C-methyltransferase n=2 Tax=Candidatus Accumulibacter TaxID=327159 RepID=A0A011PRB5_9PROT|nr:MAG: putative uroporphyrinogen-III C-methyltransferase [Candidatus Accumulibacter appositus]